MNKKKLYSTLFLLLISLVPQLSLASSISLRSSTKSTEPSKTFNVSVYVNPSSVASYTAQANISFPKDLISVESFTYASSWFPINQSGYDLIDNSSGKVIKTAGYPNGFSTETLLGTMTLKSKKAGSVVISINKDSYVLDVDSSNTLNSYGSFSITSSAPVVTPAVTKTTPTVIKKETPTVTNPKVETKKEVEKTTTIPVTENTPAISSSGDESSKNTILVVKILVGALSAYLSLN